MSRRKIVAGNWKMNLDRAKAAELAGAVAGRSREAGGVELVLCPPALYVGTVGGALGLTGATSPSGVALGAQNMHDKASGAFTGEVAPPMLVDLGCRYVILGHSERRTLFGETDAIVNAKTKAALAAGLVPIVCVGETLEEREGNRTQAVVTTQINGSLAGLSAADLEQVVIAYEPVWAIGTGKVATPQQAQEVHALIRQLLGGLASPAVAAKVRIQYGGSVKPDNAADLAAQPDIDGALVGGASLKADDFLGIAKAFA
ncbi:MAG: triose-phosphate isomerase [Planctomycetia bacterium]